MIQTGTLVSKKKKSFILSALIYTYEKEKTKKKNNERRPTSFEFCLNKVLNCTTPHNTSKNQNKNSSPDVRIPYFLL